MRTVESDAFWPALVEAGAFDQKIEVKGEEDTDRSPHSTLDLHHPLSGGPTPIAQGLTHRLDTQPQIPR